MKVAKLLAWGAGVVGAVVLVAVLVAVIVGYTAYKPNSPGWAGVADKTLWDWLNLLIIPFVIVIAGTVGGYVFARSENRVAQAIAQKRSQDEAVQGYLDQLGQLLLDRDRPLRQSEENSEARVLARARTLTLLQRLDPEHKRSVLQFLSDAYLVEAAPPPGWEGAFVRTKSPPVIRLQDADLDHADLRGMNLGYLDLSRASLRHADLTKCRFAYAVVMGATARFSRLELADLSFAKLRGTNFGGANMQGAKLKRADLTDSGLGGVDLTKADLSGANLTNAHAPGTNFSDATVTERQVLTCRVLTFATMPNGQKYEDWLKDKEERGEHLTDRQKADLEQYDEYLRKLNEDPKEDRGGTGENGGPS